jgi:hypothetical protein
MENALQWLAKVGRDSQQNSRPRRRCRPAREGQELEFPKVDIEYAGMAQPEASPRSVRLLCEEYVSLFQLGHHIWAPMDFLVTSAFTIDHLNHTNQIGRQALKRDYCVPWIHIALEPIRYHPPCMLGAYRPRVFVSVPWRT